MRCGCAAVCCAVQLDSTYALYVSSSAIGDGLGALSPSVSDGAELLWMPLLPTGLLQRNRSLANSTRTQQLPPGSMAVWSEVGLMLLRPRAAATPGSASAARAAAQPSPSPAALSARTPAFRHHAAGEEAGEMQSSLAELMEGEEAVAGAEAEVEEASHEASAASGEPLATLYLQAIARPSVGFPLLIYAQ